MAYNNPSNPDALPWFAEPEKKGQPSASQASPPPQQQNFRPQQQQQQPQPFQQQQKQPQHYQSPPPQQFHQPPPQNYRSHSPAVPPRDHQYAGGSASAGRVGLPSGPRAGAGNAPPPRSSSSSQSSQQYGQPMSPHGQHPQQPQQFQHPQQFQQPPQQFQQPPQQQQFQQPPPQQLQQLQQQQAASPAGPKLVYQGEEELTTEQLRDIFNGLDTNRAGFVTEKQLAQNLINSDRTRFDAYTVNMMVRMFDSDRSGDLDFKEFVGLWQFLDRWRTIFNRFDTDRSGNINMAEFKNTLVSFQYRLSDSFIEFLFRNYDRENKGVITFDLFMQSCITLKRMTDTFKKYDDDRDGFITINFEDFVSEFLRQMKRVMIVDGSKNTSSFY